MFKDPNGSRTLVREMSSVTDLTGVADAWRCLQLKQPEITPNPVAEHFGTVLESMDARAFPRAFIVESKAQAQVMLVGSTVYC